jgi:hypothetical protein
MKDTGLRGCKYLHRQTEEIGLKHNECKDTALKLESKFSYQAENSYFFFFILVTTLQ